eukprot:2241997-Pyramimonas_sp.AAC.1
MRVRPQSTCGHRAYGVPSHLLTSLRRQAAQCSVGSGPGRCLTTALAITFKSRDPAKPIRREQLCSWSKLRWEHPEYHARVALAWEKIRLRLQVAGLRRWRLVKVPIGATIATLYDMGLRLWSPMLWGSDQCCWS